MPRAEAARHGGGRKPGSICLSERASRQLWRIDEMTRRDIPFLSNGDCAKYPSRSDMIITNTRREFLGASAMALLLPTTATPAEPKAKSINVAVWDEQQPEQKQAYDNFLGNQIAGYLKDRPGLTVKSVSIEDDEKGLSPAFIRNCGVLLWWGHMRQADITPQDGQTPHRSNQRGDAFAHCPAFRTLVHALRRGHVRTDAARRREVIETRWSESRNHLRRPTQTVHGTEGGRPCDSVHGPPQVPGRDREGHRAPAVLLLPGLSHGRQAESNARTQVRPPDCEGTAEDV